MSAGTLAGKVCLVTGATRGIGKGIALQLAEKGATVYITGRTLDPPTGVKVGGSLRETSNEIAARGGRCIPVQCDHSKDVDIERLFDQIKRENDGQLDVLVNNAYSAVNAISEQLKTKFWDQPISMWDNVNTVGLRNHYICAVYASRMMVPRKKGLIVNVSSPGGLRYLFNVSYGIGKEACDRMAADCGFELKKFNVAFVSLWPGPVGTESMLSSLHEEVKSRQEESSASNKLNRSKKVLDMFVKAETVEFSGQCIAGLATDPKVMQKTGKIVLTADLGREYGLSDQDGHEPVNMRQVNHILKESGWTRTAWFIPNFVRIPTWIISLAGNKFY